MIGNHYRTEFKEEARELTAKSTLKEGLAEPDSEGSSRALSNLAVRPEALLAKMRIKVVYKKSESLL